MTGFFATLAARAVGAPAPLQPRPAHRFEGRDAASASTGDALVVVDDRTIGPPPAPMQPPEPTTTASRAGRSPAARRAGQHVSALEHTAHDSATEETPAPPEKPAVAVVESTSRDELDRAVHAARAAAERAARLVADQPGRVRSDERTAPSPSRLQPSSANAPDGAATPPDPAASADPDAEPDTRRPAAPLEQVEPAPALTRTLAGQQQAEPERDDASPATPTPADRSRIRPAQPVDLAALLREQVFAALAERGSVPEGLTPVVSTTPTRRAPRPGTAALHAEGVRIDQPTEQAAPGDVHVHIARVSVTQPAPPPPPRVSRSETVRRTVDHQAYLARRRERG